jgi:CheY-like chemotaxis protein
MPDARQPIQVLIVEDNPGDAMAVVRQLEEDGFDVTWQRVETEAAYLAALHPQLDIVLTDFNLPTFSAVAAVDLLMKSNLDVPIIVVSGNIEDEIAVNLLRAGAADFLLKDRLGRLGDAVRGAMEERRLRAERRFVH